MMMAAIFMDKGTRRDELHGNFGDSLTSGPRLSTSEHSWNDELRVFCRKSNFFALQTLFPASQISAFLPKTPFVNRERLPYAKQLDIGYLDGQRMRPLDTASVRYITPFRNSEWVGFWLNREPEELYNRSLLLHFLRSLNAEEFPELTLDIGDTDGRLQMAGFLYGIGEGKGVIDLSTVDKKLPVGKNMHFCLFACYANNASFRHLLSRSTKRLRRRKIFDTSFIDDVVRHFQAREFNADRMINGLISVDIMLEAGLFD